MEQESLDVFLISAVVTVLGLRIYLEATGYPRLGGGGLHIAHVLWGGLGMVAAIGILLSFLLPVMRRIAALVGGVGFGAFIDELGKFLTSDNNYFFKPTAALIYSLFVALFLIARQLRTSSRLTPEENLVNAIELSKDLALGHLSPAKRQQGLALLATADPANPMVPALRAQFLGVHPSAVRSSLMGRVAAAAQQRYVAMVGNRWFRRVVAGLFVLQAIATVLTVVAALLVAGAAATGDSDAQTALTEAERGGLASWIEAAATVLAGAFTVVGVINLWRSRLRAYRAFEIAVLLDLLLFQPFSLLNDSFAGLFGVFVDLALLGTLRFMSAQERQLVAVKRQVAAATASAP